MGIQQLLFWDFVLANIGLFLFGKLVKLNLAYGCDGNFNLTMGMLVMFSLSDMSL